MRRHHVASTLIRRHFGTKCPLGSIYSLFFFLSLCPRELPLLNEKTLRCGQASLVPVSLPWLDARLILKRLHGSLFLTYETEFVLFSGAGQFCLTHGLRQLTRLKVTSEF